MTPLNIAIHTDNTELVNFLLEIPNLDVNQIQNSCIIVGHSNTKNAFSVLKVAAKHENLQILEILLKSEKIDKSVKSHSKKEGARWENYCLVNDNVKIREDIKNEDVINLLNRYEIE